MNRYFISAVAALLISIFPIQSQTPTTGMPEGWARCTSVDSADDYNLTGGCNGSLTVLKYNGSDMTEEIRNAVKNYDVIVFDGSAGDFILPKSISFTGLSGKTLVGINGACLRTEWTWTTEIHELMESIDAKNLNKGMDDFPGGNLSNGSHVNEYGELTIRQTLIDYYNDPNENYRNAGLLSFNSCSNLIIRNLEFVGPGALDLGGTDNVTLMGCDHVWVDHCLFTDGLDGNLDIVNWSNFITVSDCRFNYTGNSYNHMLSSLTGGDQNATEESNISWIRCHWGPGCSGRMPYTNNGTTHLLNCYWDGNTGGCIQAYFDSKILVEKSHFTADNRGVANLFEGGNIQFEWRGSNASGKTYPQSNATLNIPYKYTAADVLTVPSRIKKNCGPVLQNPIDRPLTASPAAVDFGNVFPDTELQTRISLSAIGNATPSSITITAPAGTTVAATPRGPFDTQLELTAESENILFGDFYLKLSAPDETNNLGAILLETPEGESLEIPINIEVINIGSNAKATTLLWPFDKTSSTDAVTDSPEAFQTATLTLGDKISLGSTKTVNSLTFTTFNPAEATGGHPDPDCTISFDVIPAEGHTFLPKTLHLNASRIATDMCHIDILAEVDGGEPVKLLSNFNPARADKSPSYSEISLPLSNLPAGKNLHISILLYYISANKQLALSNVAIDGYILSGSQSSVGQIVTDPAGEPFYHDLQGRRVLNPQPLIPYIISSGNSTPKIVILNP